MHASTAPHRLLPAARMFSALHLSTSRHGTRTRLCGSLTRCRARRHLASCCSSRRLDRPALDTRLARKSYLSAGRSNRLGRRTGVLTVSPASPLTGVGGRPQPCLSARASSRSHARASAPAPPPEPALAVSLCTGCGRAVVGGGAHKHVPLRWCVSVTGPARRTPDVAARADDARVSVFYLFFGLNHCAQARPHIPQYDYRRVREARSLCAPTPPRRERSPGMSCARPARGPRRPR